MWGTPFCGNILGFALALQASRGLGARSANIARDLGLALRASRGFGARPADIAGFFENCGQSLKNASHFFGRFARQMDT